MLITASDAVDLLIASGLAVEVKSFSEVKVAEQNVRLRIRQHPPAPSAIRNEGVDGVVLYVVPRMTDGLRRLAAEDSRIAFAAIHDGIVVFDGRQLESADVRRDEQQLHMRRVPWVRFALLRALLRTERPRTQAQLARETSGTQAAISMHLRGLGPKVRREKTGWIADQRADLARQFLRGYPGAKGISQQWFSHHPVTDQARRVLEVAPDILISGDAGADRIAPWRSPGSAVIYSRSGLDLAVHGFAEADAESATLTVVVPADPTIWVTAEAYGLLPVVDPLICAYDVTQSGGSDAEDAVERLMRHALGVEGVMVDGV